MTCAGDVWPVIREYERTITAVVAGYVQPRVAHYLTAFQDALRSVGVPAEPMLTKSNGGVMTAELGKTECAQMLLSGTASGVIGAASIARSAKSEAAMSLDIGGTSADVAIIRDGAPQYGVGEMIGEFPIHIPTVSVTSIGEGGGSIAWVDPQGVLELDESAGSTPGPACYGRGGERPTITDAFVTNGYPALPLSDIVLLKLTQRALKQLLTQSPGKSSLAVKTPRRRSFVLPSPACILRSASWSRAMVSTHATS